MPLDNIAATDMAICVTAERPRNIGMIHIKFAVDDGHLYAPSTIPAGPARGIGTDKAECV